MPDTGGSEPIPSVKDLASSEASVRRSCLKTIIDHLRERNAASPLSSTECLQLWRGLYVALYMHDSKNALSVQNLIAELAGTMKTMNLKDQEFEQIEPSTTQPPWLDTWATAFWETVCREWASIDQWRMNKVLSLIRFTLRELFSVSLQAVINDRSDSQSSLPTLIPRQVQILEAWPLSPRERKVPDGLRLHVLDIWVDELTGQLTATQKMLEDSDSNAAEDKGALIVEAAKSFMMPVEKLTREALSKGVKMRAKEAVSAAQETLS